MRTGFAERMLYRRKQHSGLYGTALSVDLAKQYSSVSIRAQAGRQLLYVCLRTTVILGTVPECPFNQCAIPKKICIPKGRVKMRFPLIREHFRYREGLSVASREAYWTPDASTRIHIFERVRLPLAWSAREALDLFA